MVFRGCPVRWAFSRSIGPGVAVEEAPEGLKPRRATARRLRQGSGASPGFQRGRPRERTLGGSKASKRAIRPLAGEPGDSGRPSCSSCGATRAWTGGLGDRRKRGPRLPVVPWTFAGPPHGSRTAPRGKPSRRPGASAPEVRSTSNPQGSTRPPEGGTALREGKALKGESQGRCGMKQGRKVPGRAPSRVDPGQPGLIRGDAAEPAEGLRKPEGGTGEGVASLASRGRLRRSRQ